MPKVVARFYDVLLFLLVTWFLPVDSLHCFGSGSFSKWSTSFGYIIVRDPTGEQRTFRLRFRAQRTASFGAG